MRRDDGIPIQDLWYQLGGGPLKEHDHPVYGKTYTGMAWYRGGDNETAISLVPKLNQFRDFSNGDGHLHGRYELIAAVKGVSIEEAGRLFREQYSAGQHGSFTKYSEQEIGSAKKWIDGMREYSGDRLEAMKLVVQRPGEIPEEDQRLIRLWTDYGERLKSIQSQRTEYSTGSRYTSAGMDQLITAYRQHSEKYPKWAEAMVDRGQEIFEERKMMQRAFQVAQPKRSVPETEKVQHHGYSQAGFGIG